VSTDDSDDEKSSFEGERSAESFAEEIQLNIDYLYSRDGDYPDSLILDNHGAQDRHGDEKDDEKDDEKGDEKDDEKYDEKYDDESGLKDVGNYNVESEGLIDIKNTIENALS
jgi:hypothetical protein